MIITHTIASLPLRAQKQVLKTLVASLNQSIIGFARSHIRAANYLPDDVINSIDNFNERAADKGIKEASDEFMHNSGLAVVDSPFTQCQRVSILRNWFEDMITETDNFNPQYDAPFSVGNSLAYQIKRAPQTNLDELKAQAQATGIPLERLLSVGTQAVEDEHSSLVQNAGRILDVYDEASVTDKGIRYVASDNYTVPDHVESDIGNMNIETLFATLPIHAQYKMGIKINEVLIKASDAAVKLMLNPRQRGSKEAAGDVKIIDFARLEHFNWLSKFNQKHDAALEAYGDRGYLPEMPDQFDQPVSLAMDAQSAKEAAQKIAASQPVVEPVPKATVHIMRNGTIVKTEQSSLDRALAMFGSRNMKSI